MDVVQPEFNNLSFDYAYEDYYAMDMSVDYGPCLKHHVRNFSQNFLPIFYSVTCALSIITNFTLLAVFLRHRSLRRTLPLSMVSADLLFTATLPVWAVYAKTEWIFGHVPCKVVTFVYMLGLYGSNLSVGCMILQKYVDVFGTGRSRRILCCFLWILSFLATIPHLYFVKAHEFRGQKLCTNQFEHKNSWKIYLRFHMIVLGFCLPFLVLVLSVTLVLRTLIKRTFYLHVQNHDRQGLKKTSLRRSRILVLMTCFTVMFFVLWFPYTLVILLHALQELHHLSECTVSLHLDLAIVGTECIAFTHVYINPVAYVLLNKKIWRRIQGCCWVPRENLLLGSSQSSGASLESGLELELKSIRSHRPESDASNAERQGHLLPHVT
ncbi:C-C chemokine receptor type 1 [Hoplias malabaricus]|uniref:C-C chemokine receptor type 1 n=1 Tax=Hoplias malabaricus TaxID=27720 RepID=UPI00346288AF